MKLGRKAVQRDSRTLALRRYLTPALPSPPPSKSWTRDVAEWGMMLNDRLGCCTIAGAAHAIQVWTANTGTMQTVSDSVVESYYGQWDGYVAGDENSDNGGIELDVLKKWRKQGFADNQLLAFASARPANLREIRQAIMLFGGVYIGVDLPLSAQTQEVWDFESGRGEEAEKGSWGGHCVYVPAYDEQGFTCITWGKLQKMTSSFWTNYCDEAYVLLGANWLQAQNAPSGFDREQLMADLSQIK